LNPYKKHIITFFNRVNELNLYSLHINTQLKNSIDNLSGITPEQTIMATLTLIHDWTGNSYENKPIKNNGEVLKKNVSKKEYSDEVDIILSKYFGYSISQSFETLETFLKDCLVEKDTSLSRSELYGGNDLFKKVKKTCASSFKEYSSKNKAKIPFKEFWTILSDSRHAFTHTNSKISRKKINKSIIHENIYKIMFNIKEIDNSTVLLSLDYNLYHNSMNKISEYTFQFFKMFCKESGYDWKEIYD